jgi:hypothetical protein
MHAAAIAGSIATVFMLLFLFAVLPAVVAVLMGHWLKTRQYT